MEICCTYRTWLNYLNIVVCIPIYVMMFVGLMNMKAPAYMFVAYIYIAIYNVLRIYNKKVILCDDLVKALCDKLNIQGYTRGGVSEFDIK